MNSGAGDAGEVQEKEGIPSGRAASSPADVAPARKASRRRCRQARAAAPLPAGAAPRPARRAGTRVSHSTRASARLAPRAERNPAGRIFEARGSIADSSLSPKARGASWAGVSARLGHSRDRLAAGLAEPARAARTQATTRRRESRGPGLIRARSDPSRLTPFRADPVFGLSGRAGVWPGPVLDRTGSEPGGGRRSCAHPLPQSQRSD